MKEEKKSDQIYNLLFIMSRDYTFWSFYQINLLFFRTLNKQHTYREQQISRDVKHTQRPQSLAQPRRDRLDQIVTQIEPLQVDQRLQSFDLADTVAA